MDTIWEAKIKKIRAQSIEDVECLVVKLAIFFAFKLNIVDVMLEGDNKCVVDSINSNVSTSWKCKCIILYITKGSLL